MSSDDTLTQLVAGSQSDSHVGAESASASRPVRKGPKVNLARARKSTGVPAPNTSPPASPVAAPAVSPAVHTAVGLDQPDLYVGSAAAAASSAAGDLIAEHSVSVDIGMLPPVAPFTHGAHAVDDASADSAPARVAADAAVEPTTSEVAEAEDDTSEPKRKRGRPSKSVKSKPSSRSKSRTRRQKQEDDEEESAAEDDDDDEEYVDDQSAAAEESTPADKSKRKRARVTPRRAIKKERVHVDDEAEDGADAGTASGLIPPPSGVVEEAPLPPEKRTLLSILNDTRAGTPSRSAVERRRRKRLEIEARNAKLKSESTKVEGEDAAPAASVEEEAPEIEAPTPKKSGAIQMRIVDGRMVIAEESLVLAQQDSSSNYDQPFENNRTVTSASYTNRQKCEQWTQEETKLFYKVRTCDGTSPPLLVADRSMSARAARTQKLTFLFLYIPPSLPVSLQSLAQYGTDFTFISQMFPKRTRRQVKNKFKREEKENQYLIDAALKKKIPIGPVNTRRGGRDGAQKVPSARAVLTPSHSCSSRCARSLAPLCLFSSRRGRIPRAHGRVQCSERGEKEEGRGGGGRASPKGGGGEAQARRGGAQGRLRRGRRR